MSCVLVEVGTGLGHHEGLHGLAGVRVRHADDADLGDAGVLGQHLLDLGREHVEPDTMMRSLARSTRYR